MIMNFYRGALADFVKLGRERDELLLEVEVYITVFQVFMTLPYIYMCFRILDIYNKTNGFIYLMIALLGVGYLNRRFLKRFNLEQAYNKEWHHLIWYSRLIIFAQCLFIAFSGYFVAQLDYS